MKEQTVLTKPVGLVDADMIVYEAAACGQDNESGEIYSFEYVAGLIDKRLLEIQYAIGAESLRLFLTGDDNFRFDIATVKPYKGNRKQEKPFHWKNARVYMESLGAEIAHGMEADDAMAMSQDENTVICTRDKDLRQVPGWHYGWELGAQPEFALQYVGEIGDIQLKGTKLSGTGLKFFYSQIITGDTTDNIPGLPRGGPVLAYKLLANTTTEGEMFKAVREAYRSKYDEDADERLLEQGRLLWMCRGTDEEGRAILWELPTIGDDI
jgi:hypothetical protein